MNLDPIYKNPKVFGPNSNNPKLRRAFASAMIAKAKASGSLEDLKVAEYAIERAGDSRKSREANFPKALDEAAMSDLSTRTIIDIATKIDDPSRTPIDSFKMWTIGKNHDSIGRYNQDRSVWMGRFAISDIISGDFDKKTEMWLTDYNNPQKIIVPGSHNGDLDVMAVREMSDNRRSLLAELASTLQ